MYEFLFVKSDGSTLPYSTEFVTIEKLVPMKVKVPLWKSVGVRLSIEELKELGISVKYIPTISTERRNYEYVTELYEENPTLVQRVLELKAFYDELEISYSATTDEIEVALSNKFGDDKTSQLEYAERMNTARLNIKINYEVADEMTGSDGIIRESDIYFNFPELVKWIPGTFEEKDIPQKYDEEIINSSEREQEIIAQESEK